MNVDFDRLPHEVVLLGIFEAIEVPDDLVELVVNLLLDTGLDDLTLRLKAFGELLHGFDEIAQDMALDFCK